MESWRPAPPDEGEPPAHLMSSVMSRVNKWMSHLLKTIMWFGWGRLLTMCVCIPLVGFGAFFLLRTPAQPVEVSLAYASTTIARTSENPVNAVVSDASSTLALIAVHVAGNVLHPGVFDLPVDSRVVDAIRLAGGATSIADLNAINLANHLTDGQQVYVPAIGEKIPPSIASGSPTGDGASSATSSIDYPININIADVALLDELPGVGPATAQAIVTYRDQHGSFASISGLEDVPGIGPAKVAALQGLVTT